MSDNATIHKFLLLIKDEIEVMMPMGAELLHVDEPYEDLLYVWAVVHPDAPNVKRTFSIRGTGHPLRFQSIDASYVGTVIMTSGLVWHVFDRGEKPTSTEDAMRID